MIGTLIADKYELLDEIGRGGLGVVYRGKGADGQPVAIKVIHSAGDDVKFKRFEQGINSARLLNHPNIVGIQDSGITGDDQLFYVMEYVEGKLLSQELKEVKRMPIARASHIVAQICDAIDHAHYYGVLHRNLKPANIILTVGEDGTEVARVLDFGLAKSFFQANKPDQKLTATGEIVGAPEYMSPEQCMFKDEVDWRSDIYSLSCLLYHMLTGKPPFKGGSHLDTLMKQVKDNPVDLIEAAPDVAIPPAVRDAVMRSLAKDPNQRHQTMILMRDELLAALDGAAPEPPPSEVQDPKQVELRKAAETGDKNAQFALGSYLEKLPNTQNIGEIAELFKKAADQGHTDAQFRMGQAYELGLGIKRDAIKAIEYYKKAAAGGREDAKLRWLHFAAAEGDVDAQVNLALLYKSGTSLPQNMGEVERWLVRAADKRFAISEGSHSDGFSGVNARMEQVLEFAFTLANRDHPEGCYWLGIIYKDGRGVSSDEKQAAKWLIKAADKGHANAGRELETLPSHVVDEVRRGRPKWDRRKTALPFDLSAESKQLIEAVANLKKKDTLKHRCDLWESMREAKLLLAYEDQQLTRMAGVEDADGRAGAAAFADFTTLNKWLQAMNKNLPWAEKPAQELCLHLKGIGGDASLVIDPGEKPGVTLRQWELAALASNAYPVERGAFLTEMEMEPGLFSFSRVPPRPKQDFFEAIREVLTGVRWLNAAFMLEAVFEPVTKPQEMTVFIHTNVPTVSQTDLRPVADALRNTICNILHARYCRIICAPESPVLKTVRRNSICLYQRVT